MAEVRRLHERDVARGYGTAPLPEALERIPEREQRMEMAVRVSRRTHLPQSLSADACRFHLHEPRARARQALSRT